jgi:hypothetical protein
MSHESCYQVKQACCRITVVLRRWCVAAIAQASPGSATKDESVSVLEIDFTKASDQLMGQRLEETRGKVQFTVSMIQ